MAFISEILIEKYLTHGYKINFLIGITLTVAAISILQKSERDFIFKYLIKLKTGIFDIFL